MSGRKNQKRSERGSKMTAPSSTRYTGPVKGSLVNQSTQPIEVTITQTGFSGTPNRANYYFNGPTGATGSNIGVNNNAQFADYALLYDEFRVLGMQLCVAPTFGELCFMAAFRSVEDPPAPGTSFAEIAQFSGFRFCSTTHQQTMSIKMDGTDEAQWVSTDTTTAATEFKYTGIVLAGGNVLPANVVTWRVQFRSTKPVGQSVPRRRVQDLSFKFEEVDEQVEDEESHPVLLTKEQRALLRSSLKL